VLDNAPVPSSSSQMARTRRAPGRWIQRAGGPLCLSIFAHAALAVTAGTYFKLRQPTPAAAVAAMDIDVVEVPGAAAADAPPSVEPSHAAPHHRSNPASRSATERAVAAAGDSKTEPFVLVVGTIGAQAAATASPTGGPAEGDVVGEGDVAVPARLVSSSPLVYPAAARQAEIEIDLPIEIVVDAEGRVVSARALRRAGYGLDEAALRAIKAYRFSPARREGRAVPVRMRWTVQFRLR
jgi:protein TonB